MTDVTEVDLPSTIPLSETDPLAAAAGAAAALDAAQTKFPDAPVPEGDLVDLPGGLVQGDKVYRRAQVRELNGADEEKIFRALASGNLLHFLSTALECGLVHIGDLSTSDSRRLLPEMLVGDRDAILLAIRSLTYDDTVQVSNWPCPSCGEPVDMSLNIREDIAVKTLKDPRKESYFEVPLRHGGKAMVRLPNGADQAVAGDKQDLTISERNTLLLQRCVIEVDQPDGAKVMISGFPSYVLQLGIKDRLNILEEIVKRAPGPQYTEVKFTHLSCGKEVMLALALADLFLV